MQSQCARSRAAGSERQGSFPAEKSNHRNGFLDRVLASRTEMMNCLTGSHFLGLHTGHLLNKGGVNFFPRALTGSSACFRAQCDGVRMGIQLDLPAQEPIPGVRNVKSVLRIPRRKKFLEPISARVSSRAIRVRKQQLAKTGYHRDDPVISAPSQASLCTPFKSKWLPSPPLPPPSWRAPPSRARPRLSAPARSPPSPPSVPPW